MSLLSLRWKGRDRAAIRVASLVGSAGFDVVRRVYCVAKEDEVGPWMGFEEDCGANGVCSYIRTAGDPEGVYTTLVGCER